MFSNISTVSLVAGVRDSNCLLAECHEWNTSSNVNVSSYLPVYIKLWDDICWLVLFYFVKQHFKNWLMKYSKMMVIILNITLDIYWIVHYIYIKWKGTLKLNFQLAQRRISAGTAFCKENDYILYSRFISSCQQYCKVHVNYDSYELFNTLNISSINRPVCVLTLSLTLT